MCLARGAVGLEDTDVVDAVPRFTPIADPPHGSALPNTIAASSEPARDNVRLFSQQSKAAAKITPRSTRRRMPALHYKTLEFVESVRYSGFRSLGFNSLVHSEELA